ncbi:uncharacterized protein K452DRAFT_29060 [Aplosporella prunicola CBS 121167]|uniref:Integrase catalytic domain-containing protein n=1 Tax=Aplosporella prunicola CBS 121167 TaxID=1176127 RepID=A0A6A6BI77_9PEZI|nr:uncharacterized protein K452DRAFT_29060 [Aplosporella prunicola CBS 121167]KAF2142261.1 hypothetical protein K452DRAFT_29060 [Aplosporella prunicola CBS 121167]
MDLIDYRNHPDLVTQDKYVLYIRDHYSKYCMLIPLKDKSARAVAAGLLRWIQPFGLPRQIHTNNGTEFRSVVQQLFDDYGIDLVCRRPRHL